MPLKQGYDDLDKISPGLVASSLSQASSMPTFDRLISMSDTNIYSKPHPYRKQSNLSLNTGVSIGSICLIRPVSTDSDDGTTARLVPGSPTDCCPSQYRRERLLFVIFVLFYIAFLAMGALLFRHIEHPVELEERAAITMLRNKFLTKYPLVNGKCIILCTRSNALLLICRVCIARIFLVKNPRNIFRLLWEMYTLHLL